MIHRMNDPVVLRRTGAMLGERNIIKATNNKSRTLKACIRGVVSSWHQKETDPVEWEYKATLAFRLDEDIQMNDTLEIPMYGEFVVVDMTPGKRFLSVIAIKEKRGVE
ncbi:hypothetical protein [Brevibacillus halotolerans]|uniref:hypothetical protein n=1 Tax=Brevibacillus halotolerans TaxID=1507437 RepID=UPI0015EEA95C|nr:hypothetical protein [Brevibacillus halotolerans]MBA4535450.1 hypothetical protein [Brevibacillus halotolerans]